MPRLKRAANVWEALRLFEEQDQNRAARLGEFNQEIGDSGKHVKPAENRDRLKCKSEERRKA